VSNGHDTRTDPRVHARAPDGRAGLGCELECSAGGGLGIVVTHAFEVFFDTLDTSRKVANLRTNSNVSFVIGGLLDGEEKTVQYEGVADARWQGPQGSP
jgi:hypothetical protein